MTSQQREALLEQYRRTNTEQLLRDVAHFKEEIDRAKDKMALMQATLMLRGGVAS